MNAHDSDIEIVPCGACEGRGVLGFTEDGDPETCDDCYGAGTLTINLRDDNDDEIGGEG